MVILFEIFIRDENLINTVSQEEDIVLSDIYSYVESRLLPLRDRIDSEESNESPDEPMCTIIHLPTGLSFHNYSQELRDKMQDCFHNSDRDVLLLAMRTEEKLGRLLN